MASGDELRGEKGVRSYFVSVFTSTQANYFKINLIESCSSQLDPIQLDSIELNKAISIITKRAAAGSPGDTINKITCIGKYGWNKEFAFFINLTKVAV